MRVFSSTLIPIVFEVAANSGSRPISTAGGSKVHAIVSAASTAATSHRMCRFMYPSHERALARPAPVPGATCG